MTGLPMGWEWSTVGFVSDPPQYGWTTKAAVAGQLRFLRTTDITKGPVRWESVPYCSDAPDDVAKYQLAQRDIVVSRAGSVGASSLISQEPPPAVFASYLIRFRPSEWIDERFLASFLRSPDYWTQIADSAAGIALQNVNAAKLAAITMPVAPREEQERIVAAIEEAYSKLDAGEAGLRTVRQLLKRMRGAVLSAAVTGRLVPQNPTDTPVTKLLADLGVKAIGTDVVAALPDGWAWASLGSITESVRNGIFISRPPEAPPGVPILRIGAVRQLELDLTDVRFARVDVADPAVARALLRSGDLLFTRYNGNPAFVGACAVVPAIDSPLLHPDKLIRVVVNRGVAEPTFVAAAAAAGASRSFIEGVTKTTAGQAGISGSDLRLVPIPLAPVEEQRRIVSEVERQFSFLDACERAVEAGLARSAALRRSVLKTAFEGKLVPQDPIDEPASVLLERIGAERATAPKSPRRSRRTA